MIDAFLIREGIFRYQWQWIMEYCLSCTSANQSGPDIVLLSAMYDKNRQRAREKGRAWGAVVQVAPRSGGSADLACKSALQKLWVGSGPTVCSNRKTKNSQVRWSSCGVI